MAITASTPIDRRLGNKYSYPVAASTTLLQGALAALNASHQLVMATDASARRVIGLVAAEVDNSAGAAGDVSAEVETGIFLVENSAANAVTNAHIGRAAFVEDNSTVAIAGGTNSVVAGVVVQVDTNGVWLLTGPQIPCSPITVGTVTSANATNEASAVTLANELKTDFNALHAALASLGLIK